MRIKTIINLYRHPAKSALKRVLEAKTSPELAAALLQCGEAALDLDQLDDFNVVRTKLAAVSPPDAAKLGAAVSRPRFIVRGETTGHTSNGESRRYSAQFRGARRHD